ncbi:Uncharacterised protein [Mycobacteroides abscessus]|nr:Uncharacterised protein [Mycobacteroides abscessus]
MVDLDEPGGDEPVDRAVERAGAQGDAPVGAGLDVLRDAVPVQRPGGERGQHEERGFLERF